MASRSVLRELYGLDSSSTALLVAREANPDAFIRNLDIELNAACNFAAGFFSEMGSLDNACPKLGA